MKTIKEIIFILFCFMFFGCKKDQPEVIVLDTFEKHFGGESEDIASSIVIKNDTLYVYGSSHSFDDANGDHYLIKLDIQGNVIFEKTYGGNLEEIGNKIIATLDGHFLLVGTTESSGKGNKDIHVLKIDSEGNILWENTFGGIYNDEPVDIIETSNSQFCIAANTNSFGAKSLDIYLIWIDQSGNLVREVTYGGVERDVSAGLLEIENNEIMLFGHTQNFGANLSRDFYLMKLTATGDSLWFKRYGSEVYEESQGFLRTPTGGFLLSGHSGFTDPKHDLYVTEVDISGNQLWENYFGGTLHDGVQSSLVNSRGNYVLLARSMSFGNGGRDIYLVTTDSKGDMISEQTIGGSQNDWGEDIIEYGSFYFIVGHTNSFGEGDNDIYVVKINKG